MLEDMFGESIKEEQVVDMPKDKETTDTDVDKGGDDTKKDDDKDVKKEDSEETAKLKADLAVANTKLNGYGDNLSNQRNIINDYKKQIGDLQTKKDTETAIEDGKKDLPYKDVKYSKDLSDSERDDMTDAEMRMFDTLADIQTKSNNDYLNGLKSKVSHETEKINDLNNSAQREAVIVAEEVIKTNPDLASNSRELADKILVEFKEFNNVDITEQVLKERMRKAVNNINGYTPPKEQAKKQGESGNKAVKENKSDKDPFGIDAIVAGVKTSNDGNYDL